MVASSIRPTCPKHGGGSWKLDAVGWPVKDDGAMTMAVQMRGLSKARTVLVAVATAACVITAGGCSTEILRHGHQFRASDVQRLQPGMSKDEVRLTLGTPTTTSTVGNGTAFYYISQTTHRTAFMNPKEVDRKVLAVYFSPLGSVERIANYGMKDGKVFDFISGKTRTINTADESLLQQLFRNLGRRGSVFGE